MNSPLTKASNFSKEFIRDLASLPKSVLVAGYLLALGGVRFDQNLTNGEQIAGSKIMLGLGIYGLFKVADARRERRSVEVVKSQSELEEDYSRWQS